MRIVERNLDVVDAVAPRPRRAVRRAAPRGRRRWSTWPRNSMTNFVLGSLVDRLRRAFLDDPAGIHHQHAVGQDHRLALVVRDEDRRDADPRLDLLQLEAHLVAPPRVEIGERLVEQQHVGIADERPAQRDALLLAARQQRRRPVVQALSPRRLQHGHDLVADLRRRQALARAAERQCSRTRSCAARSRRTGTPCPCAACRAAGRCPASAEVTTPVAHAHLAGVGPLQPGDHAQCRGLAAAARPEQRDERPAGDLEAHVDRRPASCRMPWPARPPGCPSRRLLAPVPVLLNREQCGSPATGAVV